jgi:uncharacterized membrane protein
MVEALRFANIVLAAIFVGGTFFTFYVLRPTIRRLTEATAFEVHGLTVHRVERFLPAATIGSGACALAIVLIERELDAPTVLTGVGFLVNMCFGLLSAIVVVPLNRRLAAAEGVPGDLREQFARWDRANAVEVLLGFAVLSCYVLAALLD